MCYQCLSAYAKSKWPLRICPVCKEKTIPEADDVELIPSNEELNVLVPQSIRKGEISLS